MKVAILDVDSIAYSIGHGNKILLDTVNDEPVYQRDESGRLVYESKTFEQLEDSCQFVLNDILLKGGFTDYIGFIKGKNTIAHKLKHNSTYKQDRVSEKPKWWDHVSNFLTTKYNIYKVDNYEVDDYVVSYKKVNPDYSIVAIDSDILCMPGEHYNWKKNEWITSTTNYQNYIFWKQMIAGNHNNVKGLAKKGDKYAEGVVKGIETFKDQMASIVLTEYINHYNNLELAIDEFYKNYKSIKIKDNIEDLSQFKIKEWNTF